MSGNQDRSLVWHLAPGQTIDLGVSMDGQLDPGVSMAGETPVVSPWVEDDSEASGYAAAAGFTISAQVNTSPLEVTDKRGNVIETVAVGRGIIFRVTTPNVPGTYFIRSECNADDGSHAVRPPYDILIVAGPGSPS